MVIKWSSHEICNKWTGQSFFIMHQIGKKNPYGSIIKKIGTFSGCYLLFNFFLWKFVFSCIHFSLPEDLNFTFLSFGILTFVQNQSTKLHFYLTTQENYQNIFQKKNQKNCE